jgi:hypothetical protein
MGLCPEGTIEAFERGIDGDTIYDETLREVAVFLKMCHYCKSAKHFVMSFTSDF